MTLDMETAAQVNTAAFIAHANQQIGGYHAALGEQAAWLTGDEILNIAHANNPDAPQTAPAWLSGPGPMNFWQTHFARTLIDDNEHGRVHMMVVNTVNAYTLSAQASGAHWFIVAWFIDPSPAGGGGGNGGGNTK